MTDVELLAMHRQGDESAFSDLVRRHLGWVCGLARRRLCDEHRAEDVAQAVFVLLHRKAPVFATDGAMIGWLHKAAWYAAETAARDERRRLQRETAAAELQAMARDDSDVEWRQLAPLLDTLVGRLSRSDREAILLRYYRDLSFAEVAEQIGTTPDAARKRVERAIDKLRSLARGKGLTLSAAALPALLAANVRIIPPPGLVATAAVTATAQAGSALALTTGGIVKGAFMAMATAKASIAAAAIFAVLLVAGGTAYVTTVVASRNDKPQVMVVSNPMPTIQVGPTSDKIVSAPTTRGQFRNFRPEIWTPSPFQAIRWPSPTPQVQVNGTWYELRAVDGVSTDKIIGFIIQQGRDPLSCYQEKFEMDMLNYVNRVRGVAAGFDSATLDVKDLTTGQTQTLQSVPATADNQTAIADARSRDGLARDTAKGVLRLAVTAVKKPDDMIAYFTPLDAAEEEQFQIAFGYLAKNIQINDEILKQFTHVQVGPADHFFKAFWWSPSLNEIESLDGSVKIDLRSLGLGQLPMRKIDGAWKIDAAWLTDNAAGIARINTFLPNLLQFEADLNSRKFTTGEQLATAINALARQFDDTIPKPPAEP